MGQSYHSMTSMRMTTETDMRDPVVRRLCWHGPWMGLSLHYRQHYYHSAVAVVAAAVAVAIVAFSSAQFGVAHNPPGQRRRSCSRQTWRLGTAVVVVGVDVGVVAGADVVADGVVVCPPLDMAFEALAWQYWRDGSMHL